MSRYFELLRGTAGAALIALLFPWSAASAADTGGRGTPAGSVPARVPAAGPATRGSGFTGPLKGVIRLSPGSVRAVGTPMLPAFGVEQLDKKYSGFSGGAKAYENGAKAMLQVAKDCAAKAYTVQDQQAAGCTGSESLDQCMEKLYKHCVQTFSFAGFNMPSVSVEGGGSQMPGFSTKQFQQTAKTTAAEARVLSQLLNQYANEVEQKAKALVP